MRTAFLTIVALWAGTALADAASPDPVHAPHRQCPEDAVWMPARGAQYRAGYWTRYVCIAGDDATAVWLRWH